MRKRLVALVLATLTLAGAFTLVSAALPVGAPSAPAVAEAGDGYWSQGCGNTYWYGVPGEGTWYLTSPPHPVHSDYVFWVGGIWHQTYGLLGFECNTGSKGLGFPYGNAYLEQTINGGSGYIYKQQFSKGVMCATNDANVARYYGLYLTQGIWSTYVRYGHTNCR